MIVNSDFINTASDLKQFLTHRYFASKEETERYIYGQTIFNVFWNLHKPKIHIDDPIAKRSEQILKINFEFSYLYGMLSKTVDGKSSFNCLPLEIKKIIFIFLDRAILSDQKKITMQTSDLIQEIECKISE